jgi:hypothetical protein
VRSGPWNVWEFEAIYYVARDVVKEMGGGDVRNYSKREEAWASLGLPGEPFPEARSVLRGASPSSGSDFGRAARLISYRTRRRWQGVGVQAFVRHLVAEIR